MCSIRARIRTYRLHTELVPQCAPPAPLLAAPATRATLRTPKNQTDARPRVATTYTINWLPLHDRTAASDRWREYSKSYEADI
jgi:hypothetical protein